MDPASSSATFHQRTENEELNLRQIELTFINLSVHGSKGSAFNPQKEKASRYPLRQKCPLINFRLLLHLLTLNSLTKLPMHFIKLCFMLVHTVKYMLVIC